jgi:hypothetical protein
MSLHPHAHLRLQLSDDLKKLLQVIRKLLHLVLTIRKLLQACNKILLCTRLLIHSSPEHCIQMFEVTLHLIHTASKVGQQSLT